MHEANLNIAYAHALVGVLKADGRISTYERKELQRDDYGIAYKDVEPIIQSERYETWQADDHLDEACKILRHLYDESAIFKNDIRMLLEDMEKIAAVQRFTSEEKEFIERFEMRVLNEVP